MHTYVNSPNSLSVALSVAPLREGVHINIQDSAYLGVGRVEWRDWA